MAFRILPTSILILFLFNGFASLAQEPAAPPATLETPPVAAILATRPTTPAECLRAAKVLADLERPDLAKPLLKKVLDARLDRPELARLAKELGSAAFVALGQRKDLQPEGKQVADRFLDALSAELQDVQRIAGLIDQLKEPSQEKRDAAVTELVQARQAAIKAIIEALADPQRAAEHPRLRSVLALMDRDAFWPLTGVLENADPAMKLQVVLALQLLDSPRARLFLFEPALAERNDPAVRSAAQEALRRLPGGLPDCEEAIRRLTEAARSYFDRRKQVDGEIDGRVAVWRWDTEKKQCQVTELPAADAARHLAARLAGDAFRLAPDDPKARQLTLMTLLEASAYRRGLGEPPDENDARIAAALGVNAVEDALSAALETGHPAAAAAAAQLLGRLGNAKLLYQTAAPAPLVRAVQSPDRRVRMAALRALAALKPDRPFAGSSAIPDALAFFAASRGVRKAVIAGPNAQDNQHLVGGLAAAGYQVELAGDGRQVMRLVTGSPDYELAMIDAGIDRPPIEQLLQHIRHDNRSADLRVGVLARSGFSERAERAAAADPLALDFARPHDEQAVRWQLEQLAALKPRDFVDFQERQHQAAEALDLMVELNRTAGKLYDFRRALPAVLTALEAPALATKALAVLANLNLPEAQRALVETASRNTVALATRQAAVNALRQNVRSHGVLLTAAEIRRQYDRYNQSAQADHDTQKILGEVLDCLETKKKR
ncbi:MAG: hypothetical protein JXB10_06065 [Pirellulales bacterium]|nr:hypothetical protein [Pirellulales bacterium]